MTIKAQDGTHHDDRRCPRCQQRVEVRPMAGTIMPHRDLLVGAACPTAGMTPQEARGWVEAQRARLSEFAS